MGNNQLRKKKMFLAFSDCIHEEHDVELEYLKMIGLCKFDKLCVNL